MKFERTLLLLDREKLAIQRILLGRRSVREFAIQPTSQAVLGESYRQNDIPVYHVAVEGANGTAKFATSLSDEEKDWLVKSINGFLGVTCCPACGGRLVAGDAGVNGEMTCPACGAAGDPLAGAMNEDGTVRLEAESLTSDEVIRIEESQTDHLRFRVSVAPAGVKRWVIPLGIISLTGILVGAVTIVFSMARGALPAADPASWLFLLLPTMGLFAVGAVALFAFCGKVTVNLTRERLICNWGVGHWGYSQTVPTASIQFVVASQLQQSNRTRQQQGARTRTVCVIRAEKKFLLLTLFHSPDVARRVAALVRTKLEDMGFVVPND